MIKYLLMILLFPLCLSFSSPHALFAAIVADHTTTGLSAISEQWINTVKSNLLLSYGHTSHGSQPVSGMQVLADSSAYGPLYAFNKDGGIEVDVLSLADATPSGDLGHNGSTAWADSTRTYLNSSSGTGATRNVVVWSWCGGVTDNTAAGIDTYLNTMNQLELDYPNVTFIYMTGHLDGSGITGNLHLMNERIRAFCQTNNKILFDFADIESYDPDGNYFLDRGATDLCSYDGGNWATEWCDANSGSELCTTVFCAHSQSLNCNLKARAFWWMLARVAGWDGGNSVDTTPPVLSQGAPSGQLPAVTTETTLSLNSDENAICRYATSEGIDYDAMTNTFSFTDGTNHQHNLTNLSEGSQYSFYVRCEDSQNNSNQEDFLISFNIASSSGVEATATIPPILFLLGE